MKRALLLSLVVAGGLVVGSYWYFSSSGPKGQDGEGATGTQKRLWARSEASRKAMEPGAAGVARGGAVERGPAGEGTEHGRAAAGGVAAVKPRGGVVGEGAGSEAEAPRVDVENVPAASDKLAALKPQRGAAEQGQVVAQMPAEGEPPPEVVFEGGKEKRFVTETQVQLENAGKIAGDAGSMAFWLKPDWEPTDQNDAVFVQIGEGQQAIRVAKNVNFLRFEYFDADGRERGVGVPIDDWKPGEWHQVSATWVQGRLQLFVDGKAVSQNSFETAPVLGEDPKAYVGSKLPSGTPAAGEMADVRILNRPLQPNEIQDLARKENRPE
ncbi:hypothetical protein HRbin30_01862 [bacterium HR30]|nr:hypothetical protein HRbin30_01862 [bacterium HR30]